MSEIFRPIRYAIIEEKNPREILMLKGSGCKWKKCRFCDYYFDSSTDESANFQLNMKHICKVTGIYHKLEVINSGNFTELDAATMNALEEICLEKSITEIHFECHWPYRSAIAPLIERFAKHDIIVKTKLGVETFDTYFRESYLGKGIDTDSPSEIANFYDEVCLLQGIPGQNVASMLKDITTGLLYFERVCINIMQKNTSSIHPDPHVVEAFKKHVYPLYINDPRVDILINNIDFGVGGPDTNVQ